MIIDHDLELTSDGGQDVRGSGYGTKAIDQEAAADAGVGDPLYAFMMVTDANFDLLTSMDIAIVTDTDGAGSGEVTLLTKNYLLASLTTALGVRCIGIVPPSSSGKRYLRSKHTVNGVAPSTGGLKVWLAKAADASRANAAGTF